jgi:MinD superfamily P-loop ATPase
LPGVPLLLPELCHSCGVCTYVCPEEAISEGDRRIGLLGSGMVDGVYFRWGRLDVGEARSTPIIRAVKDSATMPPLDIVIIDAPPGVACPAVETMRGADFTVLVTEPTPFGLHDLRLAVQTAQQMHIPCGVVVNRAGIGDERVKEFCIAEGIPILLEIPDNRLIAQACSRGEVFSATNEAFAADLRGLAADLRARVEDLQAGSDQGGSPAELPAEIAATL